MREIQFDEIVKAIKDMIIITGTNLPKDAWDAIQKAYDNEVSPVSKEVLRQLLENAQIAKNEKKPLCQDTGLAVFFVKLGEDVKYRDWETDRKSTRLNSSH